MHFKSSVYSKILLRITFLSTADVHSKHVFKIVNIVNICSYNVMYLFFRAIDVLRFRSNSFPFPFGVGFHLQFLCISKGYKVSILSYKYICSS